MRTTARQETGDQRETRDSGLGQLLATGSMVAERRPGDQRVQEVRRSSVSIDCRLPDQPEQGHQREQAGKIARTA